MQWPGQEPGRCWAYTWTSVHLHYLSSEDTLQYYRSATSQKSRAASPGPLRKAWKWSWCQQSPGRQGQGVASMRLVSPEQEHWPNNDRANRSASRTGPAGARELGSRQQSLVERRELLCWRPPEARAKADLGCGQAPVPLLRQLGGTPEALEEHLYDMQPKCNSPTVGRAPGGSRCTQA